MFQILRLIIFLAGIALVYFFWEWNGAKLLSDALHSPATVNAQLVGTLAPDLKIPKEQMRNKQEFLLKDRKGQAVIVHFWATWCAPCVQELPDLISRAKSLRAEGYTFLTVAVDENWNKLDSFFLRYPHLAELQHTTTLALDPKSEIAEKFGSNRFPETFLINSSGLIDNKLVGPQPWLDPQIEAYLRHLKAR